MSVSGCMRVYGDQGNSSRDGKEGQGAGEDGDSSYFFVGKELMFLCGFA